MLAIFLAHLRYGTDGLCNRGWLTYSAGFYDDVVKSAETHYIVNLFYEIHFECAAYTAVLQSHEAIILTAHDTAFLYEVGININLTYIIDYHSEAYTALIGEYMVDQRGLSASEITREKQHGHLMFRNIVVVHNLSD